MDTTRREFLQGLPPSTSQYEFKGVKDILKKIDHEYGQLAHDSTEKSQYIVFNNVPLKATESASLEAIGHYFSSYHTALKILVIKMKLPPHAVFAGEFDAVIVRKAHIAGLRFVRGATVEGTSRKKSPDCSYRPETLPAQRDKRWPSVVVEVGLAESQARLEGDCGWWLCDSHGEVKIALGVSIDRTRKEMIIKRWEPQRIRLTRANPMALVPMAIQEITISSPQNSNSINIYGAPLILEFEKVFLRPPVSQADIQITEMELVALAREVWDEAGF
ncbi:hypothetical protein FQN52_008149 [Onygenales sp. PD_12]|nr:hypothetical protein FQN53_007680 [Emmonsiellopsis sp. PD_33]KAK2794568.1 hypothetical protein FQN52_008149 [Onygenales sp. PD_12]